MEKTKLKQVAALSIMFSMGTSAFAGEGSLWDKSANKYDTKAVDDIVEVLDYSIEASKDKIVNEQEKKVLDEMKKNYDLNYGAGSFNYVVQEITDYSKTPQGKALGNEALQKGLNPLKVIASQAVNKASNVQKQINSLDMTLADKNNKKSHDVSDYYHSR